MGYRTQIVREDSEESGVLTTGRPEPPTVVYGAHFHCPNCSAGYKLQDQTDPYVNCSYCTQEVDLRLLMKTRIEHSPQTTPAA